jgi:hypothetical protein
MLKRTNNFLFLNRQLLLDHLNESKKYLNETKGKTKENILKSSETSIVFKLFRDLESDEMARANKVEFKFVCIKYDLIKKYPLDFRLESEIT